MYSITISINSVKDQTILGHIVPVELFSFAAVV